MSLDRQDGHKMKIICFTDDHGDGKDGAASTHHDGEGNSPKGGVL